MEEDDLFGSLIKQCLPTSSQEEILRTCPFARQSEVFSGDGDSPSSSDPIGIPVESTGIVMLSLPEDFQTLPEDSLPASSKEQGPLPPPPVAAVDVLVADFCTDSERAVDLGKDSDNVWLSEGNPTQAISGRCAAQVISGFERELEKFVVLRRESSSFCDEIAFESPSKKSKVYVENLGVSEPSRDCNRDSELLIRESIHGENADTEVVDLGAEEIGEGSGGHGHKVFVDLPVRETDVGEANKNGNRGDLARKNVEDLDKFKYVRPSGVNHRKITSGGAGRRELPSSIRRQGENTGEERETNALAGKNRILKVLLDALKLVAGEMDDGTEVDFDFLETAERRGMTFPRPRWWPLEGYESYDK